MGDKKLDYSSPCRLKRVLEDIPELRVIAAHMGGYSRWNEAFSLPASDNLYFDISSSLGIIPKKMFFDFWNVLDIHIFSLAAIFQCGIHMKC